MISIFTEINSTKYLESNAFAIFQNKVSLTLVICIFVASLKSYYKKFIFKNES